MSASVAAVVSSILLSTDTCPKCRGYERLVLVDQEHKLAVSMSYTVQCVNCGSKWTMKYRIESISMNGVTL